MERFTHRVQYGLKTSRSWPVSSKPVPSAHRVTACLLFDRNNNSVSIVSIGSASGLTLCMGFPLEAAEQQENIVIVVSGLKEIVNLWY
jgi:hypothetical protein